MQYLRFRIYLIIILFLRSLYYVYQIVITTVKRTVTTKVKVKVKVK